MTLPADTPRFATRSTAQGENNRNQQKSLVDHIRAVQLGAMLGREGHVGQDVLLGRVHERGQFGELAAHLVRHETPLSLRRRMVGLGKDRGDEGRDHPAAVLAGMRQGVAHPVNAAPLPSGFEDP